MNIKIPNNPRWLHRLCYWFAELLCFRIVYNYVDGHYYASDEFDEWH